MIIYAVTNGLLDDVDTAKVREWERGFHAFMKAQFPQVGDKIRAEKAISKDTEAELKRLRAQLASAQAQRDDLAKARQRPAELDIARAQQAAARARTKRRRRSAQAQM